jgi:hypothetical protein
MRRLLLLVSIVLSSAGCCHHRPPQALPPVNPIVWDEKGCYVDGCNTCCKFYGGIMCTLKACLEERP